jgi:SAM-dependent methyltransferase
MTMPAERPAQDQQQVRQWWADRPMTYGAVHGDPVYTASDGTKETVAFGSREFFDRVDQTFYRWNASQHADGVPFGKMYPYAQYKGQQVLEVGCGMGTMAMNWALQGAHVTAVDLNPVAVAQTTERFRVFGLNGNILESDGRALRFDDASFDYVYSWGVLHHSPDLAQSIQELFRVLRPGGGFAVMLYNRHSFRQWYLVEYLEGLLHGESRFLDDLQLASRYSDGEREEGNPHTWPVTVPEMRELFGRFADPLDVSVFGDRELNNVFRVMLPGMWRILPKALQKPLVRRWGWCVWMTGCKR